MWLFFDGGFVSIVENVERGTKRPGQGELLVRARAKPDLERFCLFAQVYAPKIVETPRNDYRFRTRLARVAVGKALARMASCIDYGNFKDRVAERDHDRARIYAGVWLEAQQVDDRHRR